MKPSTTALAVVLALGCRTDAPQLEPDATEPAGLDPTPSATSPDRAPPGGDKDDRVSPFRDVEQAGDAIFVRVDDVVRYQLLAIDGVPVTELLATAEREFGEKAWKRFREDITMVLAAHGVPLRWDVELTLRDPEGKEIRSVTEMTKEKRDALPDEEHAAVDRDRELAAVQWQADLAELQRLITQRHAYTTTRLSLDAMVAAATKRLSQRAVTVNRLAAEVAAILSEFGDGHSRIAGSAGVMLPGLLPVRVELAEEKVAALEPGTDALVDRDHPFLVAIDGVSIDRWLAAALRWGSRGSRGLRRITSVARLRHVEQLRADLGLPGAGPVRLTLADARGRRRVVERPVIVHSPPRREPPPMEHRVLESNIGLLRIGDMAEGEAFLTAIDDAMATLRDTDALVIDVRGNSGGTRDATRHLFAYFAAEAPIVANVAAPRIGAASDLSDRFLYPASDARWTAAELSVIEKVAESFRPEWKPPPEDFGPWHYFVLGRHLNPAAYAYERPVAILSDDGCFSATDIFLGAFRHGTDAIFVGTPSAGGSGRALTYALPNSGLQVRLSSMASFRPDGKLYDGRGVEVDRHVERTLADLTGEDDSALRTAVEALKVER